MSKTSLFDPENSFWSFLNRIFSIAYAGLLWFLLSLPIVTIGASTTALYSYAFSVAENREGYIGKTLFSSFRQHFVQATILWLGMLAVSGFLFFDAYLASTGTTLFSKMMFFMIVAVAIILAMVFLHIFALLSKGTLKNTQLLRKAFVLGIGGLPISLTLLVLNVLFFWLVYLFPLTVVFGYGFVVVLSSLFVRVAYARSEELHDI